MPINLRYGQQAVARGFLTSQRLQQVLSKQRQLEAQGKKVSVRMILEKSKLLTPDQLGQLDRDLNIKVVKKQTAKISKPTHPAQSVGAQNFAGEAVPDFSGMTGANPDATVFEPPPPDMQQRIKAERDKAKAAARAKQDAEAQAFMGQEAGSPFGGDPFGADPFGGGDMAPEPMAPAMAPEPFGSPEMAPEPFAPQDPFGGQDLAPQPMGFGDEPMPEPEPFGSPDSAPALERMDSSPKLQSLGAEYQGVASPDDEELPTINAGFDAPAPAWGGHAAPQPPARGYAAPQPPARGGYAAPAPMPEPEPMAAEPLGGGDFDNFGNDLMSPEEMEAGSAPSQRGTKPLGSGPDLDATMFSPPPPGIAAGGRTKTGAMDKTMFSPRPPEFGGTRGPAAPARAPEPEPEPEPEPAPMGGDDWGESPAAESPSFDEKPDMDATVFSPPPPGIGGREPAGKAGKGRQGADDFGEIDLPVGKRMDDLPTGPATGDEVHPLRRGVGTTSRKQPSQPVPDEVAEELPQEEPAPAPSGRRGTGKVAAREPEPEVEIPAEEPVAPARSGKTGKLPAKAGKPELPKKQLGASTKEKPVASNEPFVAPGSEEQPKKKSSRVMLLFVLLLLVVVALLVLPVAMPGKIPQLDQLRQNPQAKPIYDHVENIYQKIVPVTKKPQPEEPAGNVAPPANTEAPASNEETPPANTEAPAANE